MNPITLKGKLTYTIKKEFSSFLAMYDSEHDEIVIYNKPSGCDIIKREVFEAVAEWYLQHKQKEQRP